MKYGKVAQMSHFTHKFSHVLAERIIRLPDTKIFCTGMQVLDDMGKIHHNTFNCQSLKGTIQYRTSKYHSNKGSIQYNNFIY